MAFDQIRLDRPLSRLELALTVIVISSCAVALMHRLAYLEAVAEATALNLTVRNLGTGIRFYVSTRLLQGNHDEIAALAGSNPVGTAIDPPPGYIGALRDVKPANIQPGQWYFDEDNALLTYHIVNTDYFQRSGPGPVRVRMKLKLIYDDKNGNGRFDPEVDAATEISLQILDPLKWKF